jgi:signal transduction histidine kinase
MSHDWRTPLTKLATGLYLVGRISDRELRLKKVNEMETQLFSLAHMLEQLQMMTILDSLVQLERQPEAIEKLLTEVIEAVKTSADAKGIELVVTVAENLPPVLMHTDNMVLALLNLLNNAIQFTPAGGLVSLTTYQRDHYLIIEVTDNGIGISEDILPRIFERFFKADGARGTQNGAGAGLGLALVKRTMELHHGGITVSSTPGVKTVFGIHLPLHQP